MLRHIYGQGATSAFPSAPQEHHSVSATLLSHIDSLATRTECPVHTEELIWLKDDAIYEGITHS